MEIPQRAPASPSITSKPPWAVAPAAWDALPLTRYRTSTHVLGAAHADVAVYGDRRLLVHARAVVAGVAFDIDGHRLIHPHRKVVLAVGVGDAPLVVDGLGVQRLVEVTHGGGGKVDGFHVCAP